MIGEIARGSWGMCKIAPVDAVQALRVPLPQQILQNLPKSPEEGRSRSRTSSFAAVNTSSLATTTTTTTATTTTTTTTTADSCNSAVSKGGVGSSVGNSSAATAAQTDEEELTILDESPTMLWSQLQESDRLLFAPVGDMTERVSPPTSDDEDVTGQSSDEEENDSDLQEQIRLQREKQKRELLARVR